MPRVKNPLPEYTDSEVLRMVAADLDRRANAAEDGSAARFNRVLAAKLRAIARRVPLWTNRQETDR